MLKKVTYVFLFMCLFPFLVHGQEVYPTVFSTKSLTETVATFGSTIQRVSTLRSAQLLDINVQQVEALQANKSDILLAVPTKNKGQLILRLKRVEVVTSDFKVQLASQSGVSLSLDLPTFYRGTIDGYDESMVALTITKNQIQGLISSEKFHLTLGRLQGIKQPIHIVYETQELEESKPIGCEGAIEVKDSVRVNTFGPSNQAVVGCKMVRIFLEADYKMYTDWGSNPQTVLDRLTGIFNNVSQIYANEDVALTLSTIYIWDVPDPHASFTSTGDMLGSLQSYWNNRGANFTGELVHFVTTKSGGGVAYLAGGSSVYNGMTSRSVVGITNRSASYGVSAGINSSVVNIPTYSWNVMVIAHEIGHNMGLPHTHSCDWADGSRDANNAFIKQAIDNCGTNAGYAEGTCTNIPTPTNGGTVMSYCHLISGVGINLANNFGSLPGAKLRAEVLALSSILPSVIAPPAVQEVETSCVPRSYVLRAFGCESSTYKWYDALSGGNVLQTGGSTLTTPTISVNTTYYVSCLVADCGESSRTAVSIQVSGQADSPTVTNAYFCGSYEGSTTLASSNCPSGTVKWYSSLNASDVLATSSTFTTPVIDSPTTYYATCTISGCDESSKAPAISSVVEKCDYCTATLDCSDNDVITGVILRRSGTTIFSNASGCTSSGYSLYPYVIPTLQGGETYELTVQSPGNWPDGLRIWLDYNKNGVFETSEIIKTKTPVKWTSDVTSFTMPDTIMSGQVRMRIALLYNAVFETGCGDLPSASQGYGEMEDYIFTICPKVILPIATINNVTTGKVRQRASVSISATNEISGGSVIYQAQQSIQLQPGFQASGGSVFSAQVGTGCPAP
ncbi:MAG: M12 family metallo-peptidase [Spirosomataceae bacterium]